jgi:hypothetical protein
MNTFAMPAKINQFERESSRHLDRHTDRHGVESKHFHLCPGHPIPQGVPHLDSARPVVASGAT